MTSTPDGPESVAFGLAVAPNPTSSVATVRFVLEDAQQARLALYDMLGRQVAIVAEGSFGAGESSAQVQTSALPSGVYVLRLEAENGSATRQLSVVR